MNHVGEEVVVLELVIRRDLIVVDSEGAGPYATLVLLGRMCSEFPGKHVQYPLSHPSALGERGEGEVVGVHFPQS